MNAPTIQQTITKETATVAAEETFDPFDLDITFIENTPAADTVLLCSTGDNCGSSCPSACTTS
ncbi:FxLD family lanthipeptide [Sphaerisporangium sp. NPDC005289]|uniref:FxLD family lanthipeptide n=1 Tax=Sphaerisporangium sp. NPDC005289 TaxID=3155247 RepID=UPI00339E37AF